MLVDPFGRRITYLRVSVTDRCNLRCVYCMPAEGVKFLPRKEILSYEELVGIAKVATGLGIEHIRLTGGEPLVREDLPELIEQLARLEGLKDLSLTTNGVLLDKKAKALAQAGLKRINISLDTLRPERFQSIARFGAAEDVNRGIEAALSAGLTPVKLNMVVLRGVNDDELVELARLTLDQPIHVRFIELMPLGEYFTPERLMPAEEILQRLSALGELRPGVHPGGCGPAEIYQFEKAQGTIGVIGAISRIFCAKCNRMRLTSTGRLRPCLDDEASMDLKPALRPHIDEVKLAELIRATVAVKPEKHAMVGRESGSTRFCMSGIGG